MDRSLTPTTLRPGDVPCRDCGRILSPRETLDGVCTECLAAEPPRWRKGHGTREDETETELRMAWGDR